MRFSVTTSLRRPFCLSLNQFATVLAALLCTCSQEQSTVFKMCDRDTDAAIRDLQVRVTALTPPSHPLPPVRFFVLRSLNSNPNVIRSVSASSTKTRNGPVDTARAERQTRPIADSPPCSTRVQLISLSKRFHAFCVPLHQTDILVVAVLVVLEVHYGSVGHTGRLRSAHCCSRWCSRYRREREW